MASDPTLYLSFWGKAQTRGDQGSPVVVSHSAAFHMLDVAAVAEAWLTVNEPFVPGIGAGAKEFWPAIVALVALHDIGKFSRPVWAISRAIPRRGMTRRAMGC